jgi:hypothetical protein
MMHMTNMIDTDPRASASLINGKPPRDLAACARVIGGRSFPTPAPRSAPAAATSPSRGGIRAIFFRYLSARFAHARPTRPAFLHIGAAEISSFVVSGGAREIAV